MQAWLGINVDGDLKRGFTEEWYMEHEEEKKDSNCKA